MLATATVWMLSVADTSASGLKFGGFTETVPHPGETFNQVPYYIIIAVGGGLLGAAFCETNLAISKWRRRKLLGRKWYRIYEALICVALTTSLGFLLPMLPYEWGGGCRQSVANPLCTGLENKYYCGTRHLVPPGESCNYTCVDHSYYQAFTCRGPGAGREDDADDYTSYYAEVLAPQPEP